MSQKRQYYELSAFYSLVLSIFASCYTIAEKEFDRKPDYSEVKHPAYEVVAAAGIIHEEDRYD